MDAEGARALAERIAAGPPSEEGDELAAKREPAQPERESEPPREQTVTPAPEAPGEAASSVEIVYVKPGPGRRREVRKYVRGPDGRLERSDS